MKLDFSLSVSFESELFSIGQYCTSVTADDLVLRCQYINSHNAGQHLPSSL